MSLFTGELNTEYGVRLMFPPYREHAFDGALMLLFNAGTKENGGYILTATGLDNTCRGAHGTWKQSV